MKELDRVQPCMDGPQVSHHPPALRQDPNEAWQFADLGKVRDMLLSAAKEKKFVPDPLIPFDVAPSKHVFQAFMKAYFDSA